MCQSVIVVPNILRLYGIQDHASKYARLFRMKQGYTFLYSSAALFGVLLTDEHPWAALKHQ